MHILPTAFTSGGTFYVSISNNLDVFRFRTKRRPDINNTIWYQMLWLMFREKIVHLTACCDSARSCKSSPPHTDSPLISFPPRIPVHHTTCFAGNFSGVHNQGGSISNATIPPFMRRRTQQTWQWSPKQKKMVNVYIRGDADDGPSFRSWMTEADSIFIGPINLIDWKSLDQMPSWLPKPSSLLWSSSPDFIALGSPVFIRRHVLPSLPQQP